jgi:hypothetical protein
VTSQSLARSYLAKARVRLKALAVLRDEGGYSDVVREAQELVELALKGMLRAVGIEPPKFHDVGGLLVEHRAKFVASVAGRRRSPSGCGASASWRFTGTSTSSRPRSTPPPTRRAPTTRPPGSWRSPTRSSGVSRGSQGPPGC